jgi:hypothetical protein
MFFVIMRNWLVTGHQLTKYASKCETPPIAFSADYCSLSFFSATSNNKFVKQMHYRFTSNSSYIPYKEISTKKKKHTQRVMLP